MGRKGFDFYAERIRGHRDRKDLPWGSGATSGTRLGTAGSERGNSGLGDDSAQLAGGGRETVGCRSVSGREAFSGNDKGGRVGTEVEEELGENVDGEKTMATKLVICEAKDAEEYCQHGESHQLNRLASNDINGSNRYPVSRDCASQDDD